METPSSRPATANQERLTGKVVVVLEDDELVRRATERLLRRLGAEVAAGRTSGEVLEVLSRRGLCASCAVADYWLSGEEGGLAAVARLCEATGRALPAVIITGDLTPETAEAVAAAGFPLLRKPVDVDRFIQALNDIS